jgi:asparagine synthase (glutamine-hydrolysing)
MCGLVVANKPVASALDAMRHRGIRSRAVECGGGVQMGHVRLPIVGLAEGYDQPVRTNGGWLSFVGEVLDFRERWPGLECDLPLVRKSWAKRGPRALVNYEGFWSVAVATDDGTIHLVVDYLNQKPLYYRSDDMLIGAASEPDALLALEPAVTPDEVYFSAVVKWGYCPDTRRTPYREIKKTLPGEHVVLTGGPGDVERSIIDELVPVPATPEDLKFEIEEAVGRRVLSSDVPVACLVSGGLDSAIVYNIARRHGDVVPYHVENDEEEAARLVAGDKLVVIRDEWSSIERALAYMQEPVDLGSLVPQCAISDSIGTTGTRVCLTGDGADEFFGGYGRAARYDSQWSDVYHELVAWHLPRLDRVMMKNTIEIRSPFLARNVARIALGLPRELRTGKKILRDLFRPDLGAEVVDQGKRPLRTVEIERDREGHSKRLVEMFRRARWGRATGGDSGKV